MSKLTITDASSSPTLNNVQEERKNYSSSPSETTTRVVTSSGTEAPSPLSLPLSNGGSEKSKQQQRLSSPSASAKAAEESGTTSTSSPLFPPVSPPAVQQQMFDSDGLISYRDEMNDRIAEMVRTHKTAMAFMQKDLKITRKRLVEIQRIKDGGIPLPGSELQLADNGTAAGASTGGAGSSRNNRDIASSSTNGSTTSNSSSWEVFEENEAQATLWVPDHSTDVCMR